MKEPSEQTAKDSPLSKVTKQINEVVTEVVSDIKKDCPCFRACHNSRIMLVGGASGFSAGVMTVVL